MNKLLRYTAALCLLMSMLQCSSDPESKSVTKENAVAKNEEKDDKSFSFKPLDSKNVVDRLKEYGSKRNEDRVVINCEYGEIEILLYKNTPLHKANFLYLTERGYFNDTWFYRVSKGHVIQAGNTDEHETIRKRKRIGDYKIPNEINQENLHKRGAVAAARSYSRNPNKESDPYEFYIILGKSYTRSQLLALAEKHEMNFTEYQLNNYENKAGSPHLDGEHTVFGEVIRGMDVVEKISEAKVDEGDWPLVNIPISVKVRL